MAGQLTGTEPAIPSVACDELPIQRDHATVFDGVPTTFIAPLSYPELDSYDVSSLQLAVSGDASIPSRSFAHPAVAEAAVIGIPDDRLGEEVMAIVTLRPGASLTTPELIAYCKERIAAYKYPRVIEFRDEVPKNTMGKIMKDELIPR